MTIKGQDSEFRHPELAAFLESLTDEQAATLPPLSLEQDGVVTRQRHDGGRVHCDEFPASGASGDPASEAGALDVLMRAAASEFSRSLPLLAAQLRGSESGRSRDVGPRQPSGVSMPK